mgnify:CR=1 FL=1
MSVERRRSMAEMRPPMSEDSLRGPDGDKGGPRRLDARDLMGDDREIVLIHKDSEYRLRITSNDKLILTK